jgi:hypothetical protein
LFSASGLYLRSKLGRLAFFAAAVWLKPKSAEDYPSAWFKNTGPIELAGFSKEHVQKWL